MFARLAKFVLAGFRPVQPGRIARGLHAAEPRHSFCNDNRPGFRPPALACHWLLRDGRLECCWHVVADGARSGGCDAGHPPPRRVSGRSRRLALAG